MNTNSAHRASIITTQCSAKGVLNENYQEVWQLWLLTWISDHSSFFWTPVYLQRVCTLMCLRDVDGMGYSVHSETLNKHYPHLDDTAYQMAPLVAHSLPVKLPSDLYQHL